MGVRADVAQPFPQARIDKLGTIGRNAAKDGDDLGDIGRRMCPRLTLRSEPPLEPVDMVGAKVCRAVDPVACPGKIGKEVR